MIIFLFVFFPISEQYAFMSDYGEPCDNFTECKDHRMACTGEENNRVCTCTKYHEWKGFDLGCVQMYDGERIMRLELVYNNVTSEIARKQEKVFSLQLWAGGFVVAVYIVAIFAVMLFCVYVRSMDIAMRRELYALKMKIGKDGLTRRKTVEEPV